jgi:rhamnosyltransferase
MRNLLSPEWYEARYGPFPEGTDLLEHYLTVGGASGNDPSPLFDTLWYTEHCLPVGAQHTILEHFVREGMRQGARPNRYFDSRLWFIHERRGNERLDGYLAAVGRVLSDPRMLRPAENPVTAVAEGRLSIGDGDEVCVFAHYDPEAVVDGYVVSTLSALAAAGLRTIFVSSCSALAQRETDKIADCTSFVLTTRNAGRDWGLYHVGLRFLLERVSPAAVTLMNDSVYAHADLLRQLVASAVGTDANVLGATDSYQQAYHVQSYFMRLDRTALASGVVEEFLEHYVPVTDKRYIINAYEIGFSRRAADHGLSLKAIYSYDDLTQAALQHTLESSTRQLVLAGTGINPTHYLGAVLIDEGCPFVKVELLRDNPEAVDLTPLIALLQDGGGDKWGRPLDHLRRIGARQRGSRAR